MIALLALPLFLAQPASIQAGPGEELAAIGKAFLKEAFALTPWTPALRGWKGKTKGLRGFEYGQRTIWLETLRGFQEELESLGTSRLDGRQRADARALDAQLEMRIALYETRAPERWNALLHVERVERMLVAEQSPLRTPSERRVAMLELLREVPAYFKHAKASLVSPIDDWSHAAVLRLDEDIANLELTRSEFTERLPAGKKADQAVATFDRALKAMRRFRAWLEESPSGLGVSVPHLGATRWERVVRAASGIPYDLDELSTRVLVDLARRERRDGARWRERRRGEVDLALVGGLEEELFANSERAMELASRAGLLPELSPRQALSFTSGDLGRPFHRGVLFLPGPGKELGSVDPALLRGADAATLAALAIRYGFPGQGLFRHEARAASSPLARALWNRSLLEGWGLYALDWVLRIDWVENDLAGQTDLASEASRQIAFEEARLLASLELHARDFELDEATEAFRRRTGVSLEEARAEVRLSLADPLRGIGVLGWMELVRKEHAYAAAQGPRRALGQSLEATLSAPYLRPTDRD